MNQDLVKQIGEQDGKTRVAIQGFEGCFHQIAAHTTLGPEIGIVPCATFREIAARIASGEAEIGVMAIENSIAGSILQNYSILQHSGLKVIGETYLLIRQHLMVNPGVTLDDVREVCSHPMALLQCADYLDTRPWRLVETEDTALSARHLAESGARDAAAVAGDLAAELFGMEIVARDIHTIKNNQTRFLIVAPDDSSLVAHGANKASLYFKTNHEHGSLMRVLRAMEHSDINLSKLQSYPIPSEPWHYMFHVDMEFDNVEIFIRTIDRMRREAEELHIYGVYKKGENIN